MIRALRRLQIVLWYLWIVCGPLWWCSSRKAIELPPLDQVVRDDLQTPNQTHTSFPSFRFEWKSGAYLVHPLAEYEIAGLVVSHNDPGGWFDIYHTKNSVDLRDLCLVWGDTLTNGSYRNAQYSSDPWTCFFRFDREDSDFVPSDLSNNHLLAGTDEIAETIRAIEIGDQVRMSGYLVSYADERTPEHERRSSLTRLDTGNGACEVLFVTGAEITKRANSGYRRVRAVAKYGFLVGAFVWFGLFVLVPILEFRGRRSEEYSI